MQLRTASRRSIGRIVARLEVQSLEGHIIGLYGRFLGPSSSAFQFFRSFEAAGERRTSCLQTSWSLMHNTSLMSTLRLPFYMR